MLTYSTLEYLNSITVAKVAVREYYNKSKNNPQESEGLIFIQYFQFEYGWLCHQ